MANKKPKTIVEQQYDKELKRILNTIKQAEKTGFKFDTSIVPTRPKKVTQGSVNRLKNLTPLKITSKATNFEQIKELSTRTTSVSVSAPKRRTQKRTVKKPRLPVKYDSGYIESTTKETSTDLAENEKFYVKYREPLPIESKDIVTDNILEDTFEQRVRLQDELDKQKLLVDKEAQEKFNEGRIVYENILRMIADTSENYADASQSLQDRLEKEIEMYGFERVMRSIAGAPSDVIESASVALKYHAFMTQHTEALSHLHYIISGGVAMTGEEARQFGDMSEEYAEDIPSV